MIELQQLTKVYGTGEIALHALRGVDALVQEGEFVAVMGSSGSGKSTLMKALGANLIMVMPSLSRGGFSPGGEAPSLTYDDIPVIAQNVSRWRTWASRS